MNPDPEATVNVVFLLESKVRTFARHGQNKAMLSNM